MDGAGRGAVGASVDAVRGAGGAAGVAVEVVGRVAVGVAGRLLTWGCAARCARRAARRSALDAGRSTTSATEETAIPASMHSGNNHARCEPSPPASATPSSPEYDSTAAMSARMAVTETARTAVPPASRQLVLDRARWTRPTRARTVTA
ncbi:Uncharacterised protein [Mycobacteroides abscessus subsp. abscessus]|nr:Uncharacterised protein [Mycobacteroides abscessus subsp. abscessus]